MIIKLSKIRSNLSYNKSLEENNNLFVKELEDNLGVNINISDISDYDCDLKLIFIETGGTEGIFLSELNKLKGPFYLLTNGKNNSLAASLEILTYLKLHNLNGEILHGSTTYLAKRIKTLLRISSAKKYLFNSNLGILGRPSDWLISSTPNYDLVKEKFGVNLINLDLALITKANNKFVNDDIFKNSLFDKNEIVKSLNIYSSIKNIVKSYNLNGITIRCFDLLTALHSTGCIALSKLNDEGIVSSCEGDISALLSMLIVKSLGAQSSFQANPSKIDILNNELVLAHCTIPLNMTESYKLDTHFESGIGVAIKGKLKEDVVTIFRLSSNLKDYFVQTGKIVANLDEKDLCRTQIKVKLDSGVSKLLSNPCGNHHVVVYGDYKDDIINLLEELF